MRSLIFLMFLFSPIVTSAAGGTYTSLLAAGDAATEFVISGTVTNVSNGSCQPAGDHLACVIQYFNGVPSPTLADFFYS